MIWMEVITHFYNSLCAVWSKRDGPNEFVFVTDSLDRDGVSLFEEGCVALRYCWNGKKLFLGG
jgi:hypothetical protein